MSVQAPRRRLFVAVALDDATRAACASVAERLRAKGWRARWVPPENFHLTVAFIGGVDAQRVEDVVAAVREVAPDLRAFEVPLDAVGAFPTPGKPRVAWVGPAVTVRAFGTLCGVVRSSLAARGFTFDDRADAHVTIARSDGSTVLPPVAAPAGAVLRVDALTLYESFTEPAGARYEAFERFAFDPGEGER